MMNGELGILSTPVDFVATLASEGHRGQGRKYNVQNTIHPVQRSCPPLKRGISSGYKIQSSSVTYPKGGQNIDYCKGTRS
jgi:hypothetical protein